MHLSQADIGYRHILHNMMAVHGNLTQVALITLCPLLVLLLLSQNNMILSNCPNAPILINCMICIQQVNYWEYYHQFVRLQGLDHKYHDIPLEEEENAPSTRIARQDIHFDSWSDQECYCHTSFRKLDLLEIYRCFGLADIPDEQGYDDGLIRVWTGYRNYCFHPEEIFLFLMMKCKKGHSNKDMCDYIFGGHASRWSFGFPCILDYLYERYTNIIGHQGLSRFVDQFPQFFEAVNIVYLLCSLIMLTYLKITYIMLN